MEVGVVEVGVVNETGDDDEKVGGGDDDAEVDGAAEVVC